MAYLTFFKNCLSVLMALQFQHLCFFSFNYFHHHHYSSLLSSIFPVTLLLYLNDAEFAIGPAL